MDCRDVACNGGALQERSGGTHCNVWGQKASLWPRHSENLKIHPWTICFSNVPVQNSGFYIHSFCHTYLDCMDALSWFPSLSSFCDPAPKKCLCRQHNCLGFSCIWVLCLFSHISLSVLHFWKGLWCFRASPGLWYMSGASGPGAHLWAASSGGSGRGRDPVLWVDFRFFQARPPLQVTTGHLESF